MAVTGTGKNALIYISGTAFLYGNSWAINPTKPTFQYGHFGDAWKAAGDGIAQWGGSISASHDQDGKQLFTALTTDGSVALLVYPKKSDISTYYSGNAIFGGTPTTGPLEALVTQNADFVGDGALTATGFAA